MAKTLWEQPPPRTRGCCSAWRTFLFAPLLFALLLECRDFIGALPQALRRRAFVVGTNQVLGQIQRIRPSAKLSSRRIRHSAQRSSRPTAVVQRKAYGRSGGHRGGGGGGAKRRGNPRTYKEQVQAMPLHLLRKACLHMGMSSNVMDVSKQELVKALCTARVPISSLKGAMNQVKREASRDEPPKDRRLYKFTTDELRFAVRLLGEPRSTTWSKGKCVRWLEESNITVRDINAYLKAQQMGGGGHNKKGRPHNPYRQQETRRGRRGSYLNDDDDDDDKAPGWWHTVSDEKWGDLSEEDIQDVENWIYGDAWMENDLYEEHQREASWARSGFHDVYPAGDYSEFHNYYGTASSAAAAAAAASGGSTPSESEWFEDVAALESAMATALRERWVAEALTRTQASRLLCISRDPPAKELRQARRAMLRRWHPDRNPDDELCSQKFHLVMAACDKLA